MATLEQVERALVNAHNAGDVSAARTLAAEVKRLRGAAAPQPDAADEYGPFQAALVGMGRTGDRLYQGAKDLALTIPDKLGHAGAQAERQRMAAEQAENTRLYAKLQGKQPVATFLGEAAPLVAAPMLGGGTVAGMAAGASLPGLIEYGTPEERLQRGALGAAGGAVGAAAGKLLGRVAQPIRTAPTPAMADAIAAAERVGYAVPIGQKTGARGVQAIEQQLAKNPVTAGMVQRTTEANQKAVNRTVARGMGETADSLTDNVLAAAKERIGKQFDAIAARNTIDVSGDKLLDALADVQTQQAKLAGFGSKKVDRLVENGLDLAARGKVDGQTYQLIRSELGKQAEKAFNGKNSTLGEALKTVQRSLDDAANESISAADRKAWAEARKQWQVYKIASKRGNVIEGGNVSPARLASRLDAQRGQMPQELADVAKIGETFKPMPDSGTAGHSMTQLLLTGGAGLLGPGPLATMFAGPIAAQKFLTSQVGQKYLTQGMTQVTPEMERMLMLLGAGTGSVGGGLLGRQ